MVINGAMSRSLRVVERQYERILSVLTPTSVFYLPNKGFFAYKFLPTMALKTHSTRSSKEKTKTSGKQMRKQRSLWKIDGFTPLMPHGKQVAFRKRYLLATAARIKDTCCSGKIDTYLEDGFHKKKLNFQQFFVL